MDSGSDATVTQVLWKEVAGSQLEELLFGLLEAMGAKNLVWRAGSESGVTASDSGRDLEAVFDRPSPDGELDRQRWWIECKGRSGTVERGAVQQAVLDACARTDVDVLVVATNSRFSNPTRDWLEDRLRVQPHPLIKLWDRDNLDRLVRRHPTVAARILPAMLSDEERLRLLISRFEELGEEPTQTDLDFFWERREWIMRQEAQVAVAAVLMFLYAEGVPIPRRRLWWQLLQKGDLPEAIVECLVNLPAKVSRSDIPRPLENIRGTAASARVLIACLNLFPQEEVAGLVVNPWRFIVEGEKIAEDEDSLKVWQDGALRPVLAFAQSDLLDACASDCARVTADSPHEPESINCSNFWGMIAADSAGVEDEVLVIEDLSGRCTVGLDVTSGCPLIASNDLLVGDIVRGIQEILDFRRRNPDGCSVRHDFSMSEGARFTVLSDWGMSWRTSQTA
ncbi:restriction endonuclease [Streptomyces decoyicus]|uniref:restriction endonuclease n=1 Tax=Streptomyces decoyicus TaxID=249567 RepID=UPI00362BEFF2